MQRGHCAEGYKVLKVEILMDYFNLGNNVHIFYFLILLILVSLSIYLIAKVREIAK